MLYKLADISAEGSSMVDFLSDDIGTGGGYGKCESKDEET